MKPALCRPVVVSKPRHSRNIGLYDDPQQALALHAPQSPDDVLLTHAQRVSELSRCSGAAPARSVQSHQD